MGAAKARPDRVAIACPECGTDVESGAETEVTACDGCGCRIGNLATTDAAEHGDRTRYVTDGRCVYFLAATAPRVILERVE